jgi:hypothetical protein
MKKKISPTASRITIAGSSLPSLCPFLSGYMIVPQAIKLMKKPIRIIETTNFTFLFKKIFMIPYLQWLF